VLTYTLTRVKVYAVSIELQVAWGAEIVRRRKESGLSQKELADMAGTTQQYLSVLERGTVSPGDDLRMRLASALGTTVGELFTYPDSVPA
jgi:transcriptional regulator with XRE-family HTH domain